MYNGVNGGEKMSVRTLLFIALIVGLVGTSTVQAANPASQACLGKSVSTYAQYGVMFGDAVSDVARNPELYGFDSLGAGVQYILAGGMIPPPYDQYIVNQCSQ